MSFSPNIPMVGDFLSISQKQMIANFQAINAALFTDHVGLTAVDNVGQHNALTLRPQGSDPTTGADQCALYNKLVSTVPQLFFRSNSDATPIQMSNSNLNTIQTGATGASQSSFIAGPFTVYCGFIAGATNGQVVVLSPSSVLKTVSLTTWLAGTATTPDLPNLASTATATAITGSQFTITFTTSTDGIPHPPTLYYWAIGQ